MTAEDVEDIYAYQSRADVCRYLRFEPRDLDLVREKVTHYGQATTLTAPGDYWQLALDLDGRVIGDLYFMIASAEHQTGEIGWTLHPDHHGRGYMTEAATAILDIAFREIALHRVKADLDPRNTGSSALCNRLGTPREASFGEDLWVNGEGGEPGVYP